MPLVDSTSLVKFISNKAQTMLFALLLVSLAFLSLTKCFHCLTLKVFMSADKKIPKFNGPELFDETHNESESWYAFEIMIKENFF